MRNYNVHLEYYDELAAAAELDLKVRQSEAQLKVGADRPAKINKTNQ